MEFSYPFVDIARSATSGLKVRSIVYSNYIQNILSRRDPKSANHVGQALDRPGNQSGRHLGGADNVAAVHMLGQAF